MLAELVALDQTGAPITLDQITAAARSGADRALSEVIDDDPVAELDEEAQAG